MDRERFEKQLNFILEIDKEKQILRQTHIRGYSRQEDDAEHAWHMAVIALAMLICEVWMTKSNRVSSCRVARE